MSIYYIISAAKLSFCQFSLILPKFNKLYNNETIFRLSASKLLCDYGQGHHQMLNAILFYVSLTAVHNDVVKNIIERFIHDMGS